MSTTTTHAPETLTLQKENGCPITAMRYAATGTVLGLLVVAGATSLPEMFYREFAVFAASRGYISLTLDYRRIGLSKPVTLRGFRMHYLDGVRQDLNAAAEAMATDATPLFMIGHSFSGHAFGLMPNHRKVARFCTFATDSSWHGWMPALGQFKVQIMWRVLGPLMTRWKGYLPRSKLGMGYFRRQTQPLWEDALRWFGEHRPPAAIGT